MYSKPVLINCTFSDNLADLAGGGMYNDKSDPTVTNCIFSENVGVSTGGGGIYNDGSIPMLTDCDFIANSSTGNGGAVNNSGSDPLIINCKFNNNAADYGGGISNDNSNPELLNCVFTGNFADSGGGGGMCNYKSDPILVNCRFIENSSVGGGGMFNEESEPLLSDCTFSRNTSTGSGGGIFNENGNPVLLGCIFNENSAPRRSGGGIYSRSRSQPSLSNCIFTGNSAVNGGAMDNIHTSSPILINCTLYANIATQEGGGISSFQDGLPTLINCILWGNSDEGSTWTYSSQISGQAEVMYSCVQNSTSVNPWPGEGNINTDPLFVNPENDDYHLKSQAGRWNPASQSWVIDQISSPCIDAGDPGDSVGLERLPNGERINMGAYGGTPEGSLSLWQPEPVLGQAMNPFPENGAVDVDTNIILSWTPGLNAVLHDVYFGTNREDVANAERTDTTGIYRGCNSNVNYTPPEGLINSETYYWRIDEVNDLHEDSPYKGEVWSFSIESETSEADLVAYYPMNEGRGTIIGDASGNNHDGIAQAPPEWINGPIGYGRALYFDGSDPARSWVNCGTWNPSAGTGQLTVALWIRWDGPVPDVWQDIIVKRDSWNEQGTEEMWVMGIGKDSHIINFNRTGEWPWCGDRILPIGQWSHVAVTFDGTIMIFYVDGQETGRGDFSFGPKTDSSLNIGAGYSNGWGGFHGALDEIRLYNIALSPDEIIGLAAHYDASNPQPANGSTHTESWVTLRWSPGISAVSHDVYFGDDRDSVDTGTGGTFMGNQTDTWFNIFPVQWSVLVPGTTYFWRIDEVCADGTIYKGNIWSFSTASSTGPPKGRACFTSETIVWMNDALIPISTVNSGQKLRGMNIISKIQKVQVHNGTFECYDMLLESGDCLSVAENHYFLAECGRWISLHALKSGTRLKTIKDSIEIIKITKRPVPYVGKVYNLKIDGSDQYLVGKDAIIVRDY
jgi:predicted outer membrane repeat protein